MNEIYSRGVAGNLDWIEIYNGASTQIDVSGYKIYDNGGQGGTKPKKALPAGTHHPLEGLLCRHRGHQHQRLDRRRLRTVQRR